MKRYRNAIACLLAAVMALCALTACGGIPGQKTSWEKSRTYQFNRVLSSETLEADVNMKLLNSPSEVAQGNGEWYHVVRNGSQYALIENGFRTIYGDHKLYEINDWTGEMEISAIDDAAAEGFLNLYAQFVPTLQDPGDPVCKTVEINDKTYVTESFTGTFAGLDRQLTYYYNQNNSLAYVVETIYPNTAGETTLQLRYANVDVSVDSSQLEIPTGYTVTDHTK